jgi:hypothetical protein
MFCSDKYKERFQKLKTDLAVLKDDSLKYCAKTDCNLTVRAPCCCKSRAVCACGQAMCFKCGDAWHDGKCKYEGACWTWLYEIMRSDMKRCPECQIKIIKNEGCIHMHCPKCATEFCWECRMKISSDWEEKKKHDSNPFGCFMG